MLLLLGMAPMVRLSAQAAQPSQDAPNFIVILGEAQGWSSTSVPMDDAISSSKSDIVRTPNLEKLAAAGMRFANFYAASPRCTPTRAALFTGRSPAALHMTFVNDGQKNPENGFSKTGSKLVPAPMISELPESETTIAKLLKKEGYATAHFGKWHVGKVSPSRHGFDESDGATNNGGPQNLENPNPEEAFGMTERGMDFAARQSKAGKPFYLQISHYPGRGGVDAKADTYESVRKRIPPGFDAKRVGSVAVTEDMDTTVGLLLNKLEELGIHKKTYILFTSDHGATGRNANGPLSQGKGTIWEGGIRVPLIIRGPGIPEGACSHIRASTMDLFPTIAALARSNEPLPANIEGGNLGPALSGSGAVTIKRPWETFVVHVPHYDKGEQAPASTLFLDNLKLIHSYETETLQLFDIGKDIGERHNLAGQMPKETAELDRRLLAYLAQIKAQMPSPNPSFDPTKPQPPTQGPPEKRGGGGRKPKPALPN